MKSEAIRVFSMKCLNINCLCTVSCSFVYLCLMNEHFKQQIPNLPYITQICHFNFSQKKKLSNLTLTFDFESNHFRVLI